MLVRCLYASRVRKPLTSAVLDIIFDQCCRNDPRCDLTGLLVFAKNVSLEIIEGSRSR